MRTRILLVEDEPTISEPLAESLGRDGFEAEVTSTLAGAREAISTRGTRPRVARCDASRWRRTRSRTGDPQGVRRPDRHAHGAGRGDRSGARARARRGRLRRQALLVARAHREDPSHHAARPYSRSEEPDRDRGAPSRSHLAHRHQGRRTDRARGSRVRPVAPPDGERRGGAAPGTDHGRGLGSPLVRARPRRSTCTSPGSARRSRTTPRIRPTSRRSAGWASGSDRMPRPRRRPRRSEPGSSSRSRTSSSS